MLTTPEEKGEARGTGATVATLLAALGFLALAACGGDSSTTEPGLDPDVRGQEFAECDLNQEFIWAQTGRGSIIDLDDPVWVRADASVPDYLNPEMRVVGVVVDGQAFAVPFGVLWNHEIVNLDASGPEGTKVAITYCPLTGSSLVFDRRTVDGVTLGVSGVLFMNNLVMFERNEPNESLWPQMFAEARCGPATGTDLARHPFVEMQWSEWLELHPSTSVLAGLQAQAEAQDFDPTTFDYSEFGYPYGSYREIDEFFITEIMPPVDSRRPPKERVVGAPSTAGDPGIAFPFGALEERDGAYQTVDFMYEGEAAVVFWSDVARGGTAYRPLTRAGDAVTLRATDSGFEDEETESRWTLDGRAVSGPMEGARLVPLEEAYTGFWGAWAAFHPETRLWEG